MSCLLFCNIKESCFIHVLWKDSSLQNQLRSCEKFVENLIEVIGPSSASSIGSKLEKWRQCSNGSVIISQNITLIMDMIISQQASHMKQYSFFKLEKVWAWRFPFKLIIASVMQVNSSKHPTHIPHKDDKRHKRMCTQRWCPTDKLYLSHDFSVHTPL